MGAITIAPHEPSQVLAAGSFTREQVDLIKRTVADGASDDELALFLEVCRSSGLNPFQRQIYAVMRQSKKKVGREWVTDNKMVIQTGIDGYRLIAARSGVHAGTSDAEYGPVDQQGYPEWARVSVKKIMPNGLVADFTATARWREYVQAKDEYRDGEKTGRQVPSGQWPKMPFLMLGKCAEALALRKAFPAELSGVYTSEEMSQADSDPTPAAPPPTTRQVQVEPRTVEAVLVEGPIAHDAVDDAKRDLLDAATTHGLEWNHVGQIIKDQLKKSRVADLTPSEFTRVRDVLIPLAGTAGSPADGDDCPV